MKTNPVFPALCLAAVLPLHGFSPQSAAGAAVAKLPKVSPSTGDATRVTLWREAGNLITRTLERTHPNPWFRCSRERFLAELAALDRDLPHLSEYQTMLRWRLILAGLGDEHTLLWEDASESRTWPLVVRILPQGVLITNTDEAHQAWLGARVLAVGNLPVNDFLQSLRPFVSAAVPAYRTAKLARLFRFGWEWQTALGLAPEKTGPELTLELRDGQKVKEAITATEGDTLHWVSLHPTSPRLRDADPEKSYTFSLLQGGRTLYVRYRSCRDDVSESFEAFTGRVQQACHGQPLARVIVDLRANDGGNSAVFDPMLRWIEKHPAFSRPSGALVLTDVKTFSSAFLNAWSLQTQGARILGSEPGQPINAYGDIRATTLPGLPATFGCSTKAFIILPKDDSAWRRSLKVDLALDETAEDALGLTDSVLDRTLAQPFP